MSKETAWQIEQTVDGESHTDYVRSDGVASMMIEDDQFDVTVIGYQDTRSKWEKTMPLGSFGSDIDVEIDPEAAVEALNAEAIADHYDQETADELERVGSNWEAASDAERSTFILLFEQLQKMSEKAERLLDQRFWGRPA